jgi:type 1 glutamine amidotransferase
MRTLRLAALLTLTLFAPSAWAADPPKRLLLVTHSGGFMHDSIYVAEQVLTELGPKHGFQVTTYRFTGDPDAKVTVTRKVGDNKVAMETTALAKYSDDFRVRTAEKGQPPQEVTKDNCGRINAETLKNFDAVLFFTTGAPVTKEELEDLSAWVKAGGAFAGTHCATDTLYVEPYGELIGAFFDGHPWTQKVKLHVEDPEHAAGKAFKEGDEINDEIYQFRDIPYSRDRLHIILSIDNSSVDVKKGKRKDQDYAVSWCQEIGKGRSFYTSLGHRREVWRDPRFQEHLFAGLKWAVRQAPGDATPTAKLKKGDDK